jgi:uncharacterized protein YeaO (DUF488 family)
MQGRTKIRIKRVYDAPSPSDGTRILVDRLWPRGLKKEQARVDIWMRDLAPSTSLRSWFSHEPARWDEFKKRFYAELDARRDAIEVVLARKGTVTLLYGSREDRFNNAVALKEYLVARVKLPARKKSRLKKAA